MSQRSLWIIIVILLFIVLFLISRTTGPVAGSSYEFQRALNELNAVGVLAVGKDGKVIPFYYNPKSVGSESSINPFSRAKTCGSGGGDGRFPTECERLIGNRTLTRPNPIELYFFEDKSSKKEPIIIVKSGDPDFSCIWEGTVCPP